MKKWIPIILIALFPTFCQAQFPDAFLGEWKGKLSWMVPGKETREFAMSLEVKKKDSVNTYNWFIKYGDNKTDIRPYTLKLIDTAKQQWAIDEDNGIILDNYVAGNCLQGSFTVMNNTIVNNYCVESGKMRVEFFTIRLTDKKTSGKGTADSPSVDSYRMAGYQYGLLEKVR